MATYAGDFSRKGPGLLLRELLKEAPLPGTALIAQAKPDVILLTDFDYDAGLVALGALRDRLRAQGLDLPHLFATRPNTGMATGRDLDGDGRLGGPRDAQGFGYFSGQGGQAVLSRWPLTLIADHSALLWQDLPGSAIAGDDPGHDIQRLSSSAHWVLRVDHPNGPLDLLTIAATPPVFDGPEDRNGRRNGDEIRFWQLALQDGLTEVPVILLGNLNLDPERGEGLRHIARDLLADPRLQDPLPQRATVKWDGPGEMRISYVLPDAALRVEAAGITQPASGAGPHRLVWVDLAHPGE
ncbi:MAG: endonuclease/exonuclease/phosphatase family protein [Pelagimonas sp.]|nr:endonuclease/exonuclease/phosphatase family protein [Pelagimonas sp.]